MRTCRLEGDSPSVGVRYAVPAATLTMFSLEELLNVC